MCTFWQDIYTTSLSYDTGRFLIKWCCACQTLHEISTMGSYDIKPTATEMFKLTSCLLWQGAILMVIRQRLKASHHDNDPTPKSLCATVPRSSGGLDFTHTPVFALQNKRMQIALWLWSCPQGPNAEKHPLHELMFCKFTPLLIQFLNVYLGWTDMKI